MPQLFGFVFDASGMIAQVWSGRFVTIHRIENGAQVK
jgi:hypothetical protein